VRFNFKDERTHPPGEQIGLIAQEVQSEFPALVSEGDDGMLSLSYTKFSAVLLKGLQEQQSTIDQQEERIATLEAENDKIKERLAALEAEQSSPVAAGLMGSWGLALLLGLGGLVGGVLWRRRS
jgi:cell shape-determining protein MreC